jgi:putative tryptophan/tyrosine transport system substrate-binding protein
MHTTVAALLRRGDLMRRSVFVSLIAGAAVTWAVTIRAQPAMLVIGILNSTSAASVPEQFAPFHRGLGEAGYVTGQNVAIEIRSAENDYARLPALAAELVRHRVAVLVAAGGPVAALAAKAATAEIPIVFTVVTDPVKSGLVASLKKPGVKVTGTSGLTSELDPKRLELLQQIKPGARTIGVLVNPNRPDVARQSRELETAADTLKLNLDFQKAGMPDDIEAAFATFAERRLDGVLVTADPFFNSRRGQLVELAKRHALPAIYQWREFATAGGLMSYGPSIAQAYHQAGVYTGRILRGANAAELPVVQPTRFDLVINIKTAKALSLAVPESLRMMANEVIE